MSFQVHGVTAAREHARAFARSLELFSETGKLDEEERQVHSRKVKPVIWPRSAMLPGRGSRCDTEF